MEILLTGGDILENQEILCQIGSATYVIERLFSQERTPQEIVIEEIIATTKQAANFDHSAKSMV